jgi:FtsP/CotA-like multicopper oxidase with cupredoxin domain
MGDIRQQGGGLYGPLLVLPDGEAWEPETDRVHIVGNGFGEIENLENTIFLNGTTEPDSTEMTVGTTYRLRFINIALGGQVRFRLARNGFPVEWRPLAQDAWDLPPHQRDRTAARKTLNVGETYDVTYTPEEPGERVLQVRLGDQVVEQPIRVKEKP